LSIFESLPFELRILVLRYAPDFAMLHALVHASPSYHQAYVRVREEVLSAVIEGQHVSGTEVDALGAILSLDYSDGMQNRGDEVVAFLDRYRQARGVGRWMQPRNRFLPRSHRTQLDNLTAMLRFQRRIVRLTEDFLEYVSHLDCRCLFGKVNERIPLSTAEEMHIHRAIYRL
jgi:hypothetical protein